MKLFLEGPGAGYTINAQHINYIDGKDIKVKFFDVKELVVTGDFEFNIGTLSAESYYYDTGDIYDVPCVASEIHLELDCFDVDITKAVDFEKILTPSAVRRIKQDLYNAYADDYDSLDEVDFEDFSLEELNISAEDFNTRSSIFGNEIKDLIVSQYDYDSFSMVYGAGYIHSTFDGEFYDAEYCANLKIDDSTERGKQIIEYVDKAVQGENVSVNYEVYIDNDYIDSFYNEDDEVAENEAITYAKDYIEHNEVQDVADCYVQRVEWLELFNGTDYDTDIQDSEIVWNGYDEYELDNDEF